MAEQKCQCIARTIDPARTEIWKRVFPPDGNVPIITPLDGHLADALNLKYVVDFDRVNSDEKARLIKEMAVKFEMSEEETAKYIAENGVPIDAASITVVACPLHDTKSFTPEVTAASAKPKTPRRKKEKPVTPATNETTAAETGSTPPPPAATPATIEAPAATIEAPAAAVTPPVEKPAEKATVSEPSQPRLIRVDKRKLDHKLTDEELRLRSIQLANTFNEISMEKARQAEINEELKANLTQLVSKQRTLAKAVQTGVENVDVDVAIYMLPGNETVSEVRKDTGVPIGTRPATEFERQGKLFGANSEKELFGESENKSGGADSET